MAHSRRSSEIGHSPSMRTSMRLSMQPDEEDDYDLEAMGMVSDGFRPQDMQQTPTPPQHDRRSSTVSAYSNSNPPPRPSSISKPKGLLASDNLALRHDGAMGPLSEHSEGSSAGASYSAPARSMSMSSTGSSIMPQQETPYTGPTGPSHQYNMYPQQSSRLARTASVATTSTMQAPASVYDGPNGPTHPYGMYPQTTESDTQLPAAPVNPAGFPGLRNDYQRRLGPDGEEIAGIIGPDGHTEELPPYTQFPDEAYARKTCVVGGGVAATPVAGPSIPANVANVANVANAGGIGLATRNPEFESRDSLTTPQSRLSSRSLGSEVSSHQVNTAAAGESEKPQLKHWQIVAKRKICNIVPIWVVVLIFAMFCLMGIILGAVLGSLRPKHHNKYNGDHGDDSYSSGSNTIYATVTTTFDASPLTTSLPSGFPALPTGVYNVGLGQDTAKNPGCIIESSELEAWSCNAVPTPLQINITTNSNSDNQMEINGSPQAVADTFSYGTQAPVISPQKLSLVTDNYDVSRGPAWFFQITYDKLVIIPSSNLYVSTSQKRDSPPPSSFQRKQSAQAGDKPWFCYWNNTLLESFIYPNQSATYSNSNGSSSSGSGQPSSTYTSASSISTAQANQRRQYTSTSSTSTWSSTSSSASSSSTSNPYFTANFPKVMKLEERRIPEGELAISPYCVQMQILDNGSASPVMNSTNQPVTIYINETEPTFASMSSKRSIMLYADEASLLADRSIEERQSATSCSCEWIASGY